MQPPYSSPSLAFLLANYYSGATLLTLLLDGHSQIASNGELFKSRGPLAEAPNCSCGAPLDRCEVYGPATAHMRSGSTYDPRYSRWIPQFSRLRALERILSTDHRPGRWKSFVAGVVPGARRRALQFVEAHERVAYEVLRLKGGTLYLDGCKDIRRTELFLSLPRHQSSPLVHLVRHPTSWIGSVVQKGGGPLDDLIGSWRQYIVNVERLAVAYSVPLLTVRYEDLCEDPREELCRISEHLGLDYDAGMLEAWEPEGHHVLGNVMRRTFDGIVRPAPDRSAVLSIQQRERVLVLCADLMHRLGYR